MATDYLKKLNYKPEGRRNVGRPRTRWEDDFREEGTGLGLIVDDEAHVATFVLIGWFITEGICSTN